MSLMTIVTALAKTVGMQPPNVIATSPERQWIEALQIANEAGEELARRVDWGQLHKVTTLTGDDTNQTFTLPGDTARLTQGIAVRTGNRIVRPLSRAEWSGITPKIGTPRYFLLEGREITLWPYMALGVTATVNYLTTEWATSGAGFVNDDDTALFDENLLLKGLIVRWRRQKGMPYSDEEAEYEAALQDAARFDSRSRF